MAAAAAAPVEAPDSLFVSLIVNNKPIPYLGTEVELPETLDEFTRALETTFLACGFDIQVYCKDYPLHCSFVVRRHITIPTYDVVLTAANYALLTGYAGKEVYIHVHSSIPNAPPGDEPAPVRETRPASPSPPHRRRRTAAPPPKQGLLSGKCQWMVGVVLLALVLAVMKNSRGLTMGFVSGSSITVDSHDTVDSSVITDSFNTQNIWNQVTNVAPTILKETLREIVLRPAELITQVFSPPVDTSHLKILSPIQTLPKTTPKMKDFPSLQATTTVAHILQDCTHARRLHDQMGSSTLPSALVLCNGTLYFADRHLRIFPQLPFLDALNGVVVITPLLEMNNRTNQTVVEFQQCDGERCWRSPTLWDWKTGLSELKEITLFQTSLTELEREPYRSVAIPRPPDSELPSRHVQSCAPEGVVQWGTSQYRTTMSYFDVLDPETLLSQTFSLRACGGAYFFGFTFPTTSGWNTVSYLDVDGSSWKAYAYPNGTVIHLGPSGTTYLDRCFPNASLYERSFKCRRPSTL